MKLHRIDALIVSGNNASSAVLRKCGFNKEAVLSDHGLFHGRYHDMEMFGHIDRSRADQVS